MTNREQYEAWAVSFGWSVDQYDDESYCENNTADGWEAWQAALVNDQRRSVEDIADAVAAHIELYKEARSKMAVDDAMLHSGIVGSLRWSITVDSTESYFDANAMMNSAVNAGRELRENTPE